MKGFVNRIIENSFIDGPGNRMAIFMQGCNMACLYCHNPETQRMCTLCKKCLEVCSTGALSIEEGRIKYDRKRCIGCDKCLEVCLNFSSPKYFEIESDELVKLILKNEIFLDGITFSGGECTLQTDFIIDVVKKVKNNSSLTAFIDTNGLINDENLNKLISCVDGFMLDVKAVDDYIHRALTGVSNELVLKNLNILAKTDLLYEVRYVLVEGYNDSIEEIKKLAELLKELNDYTRLVLIPFRPLGVKTHFRNMPSFNRVKYDIIFEEVYKILKERLIKKD
ncbi:YjjW family glycine radical enzyme activase [Caloramator proteoclasticus]|uniref:Pyruvate formate lyase activating enzyme n=1 Tax=Caloramator proteoclasticus DSM 10124 TaxID=1121262 RepID=A0A1M4TWR5_9CLOT|nr:YjjW family glycine radical enzyme activase [Caloramator proteoclasticus]SHE48804.1 pyruvate formate lyase activating enzyme [Caloramator proteoclasticus DSM 10124]